MKPRDFALVFAALLHALGLAPQAKSIGKRLRLSNDEVDRIEWLVTRAAALDEAPAMPWPRLQRILIHPYANDLLDLHEARAVRGQCSAEAVAYCRARLAWDADRLNPPPLVTGDDLKAAGINPGRHFKELLEFLRDKQLEGRIRTAAEALALAARWKPA